MSKKILLVDGNGSWRVLVRENLIALGHHVDLAQYDDSIDVELRLKYDLVVLGGPYYEAIRPVAELLGEQRMPYIALTTINPIRNSQIRDLFVKMKASDVLTTIQSSGYTIEAILGYFERLESESSYKHFARENE